MPEPQEHHTPPHDDMTSHEHAPVIASYVTSSQTNTPDISTRDIHATSSQTNTPDISTRDIHATSSQTNTPDTSTRDIHAYRPIVPRLMKQDPEIKLHPPQQGVVTRPPPIPTSSGITSPHTTSPGGITSPHTTSPSSPSHHPHYLRRNEWLKHAAVGALQFEDAAKAQATPEGAVRSIRPPSYYHHLLTSQPTTEQERIEREHTLRHMSVYDVDIHAPPPPTIRPEEIDVITRKITSPRAVTRKVSSPRLVPKQGVGMTQPALPTTDMPPHTEEKHEQQPITSDEYTQGQVVSRDTVAWDLIKHPPAPAEGHAPVPDETPEELDTNVYTGLTQQQVDERQARDGKNELKEKRPNMILKFLGYFIDPIGLLIIAAAVISAVLKSWIDFGVITGLLFVNAIIGFVEEAKAESAVAALQQKLALKTHVMRVGNVRDGLEGVAVTEADKEPDSEMVVQNDADGRLHLVSVKELVRGDVFSLRLGDIVPADARLLGLNKQHVVTNDSLMIDQSALTGESLPVEKKRGDIVYSGSTVKQGQMLAVVVQTGERTFLGRAAHLISTTAQSGHFQKVIGRIGTFLIVITLVLVVIILIVGTVAYHHSFLDELEQALVLTIASIPVGLPTVLSVTMAVGSKQLSRKQVIVKRLTAVEEMAAVDILCSDKTGTLTLNELTLDEPFVVEGATSDDLLFAAFLASESGATDAIEECVRNTAVKVLPQLKGADVRRADVAGYKVLQFHPFDPISKLTRATIKDEKNNTIFCVAKGAPHVILKLCCDNEEVKRRANEAIINMAKKGLRALGVARSAPITDVNATGIEWHLLGLLSLLDPPRPDSKATIQECLDYGIQVKMITGDAVLIAKEVARRLGIFANILTPDALHPTETRTEDEIVRCVEKADGFAQVVPEDKYRIVETLQEAGHIVAMTGDGVNDAPALKKANVGIAVHGCTDAARSAADIVLLRPGLSAIVDGIITSRTIFQRMHSYATYRITSTIHFLLFFFITILAFEFSLRPILIIMIALLNDAAVMVVAVDNATISRKPDAWRLSHLLTTSAILGVCLTASSLAHFFIARDVFELSEGQIQTVIYLQMSSCPHFVIFSTRVRDWFWTSRPSIIFISAIAATQIFAFFICVYGVVSPAIGWRWSLAVMSVSLGVFVLLDAVKVMINRIYDSPKFEEYWYRIFPTKAGVARLAERHRLERFHHRVHVMRSVFQFIFGIKPKPVDIRVDDDKMMEKHEAIQKQAADTYITRDHDEMEYKSQIPMSTFIKRPHDEMIQTDGHQPIY